MLGARHTLFLAFVAALEVALALSLSPRNTTVQSTQQLLTAYQLLNATVGGRLRSAVPLEKPCFSSYEGKASAADPAACAAVQANYTDPTYRVTQFGGYMLVSSALPRPTTC